MPHYRTLDYLSLLRLALPVTLPRPADAVFHTALCVPFDVRPNPAHSGGATSLLSLSLRSSYSVPLDFVLLCASTRHSLACIIGHEDARLPCTIGDS